MHVRIMLGITKHIVSILFNEQQGNPVLGATFSLNRNEFSVLQVKFDEFTTKFAKYGLLFNVNLNV